MRADTDSNEVILSIIVPIYNVEKYLVKCIDSLLKQDIPQDSYEIILVNDGSTDNSIEIAQKYVGQNPGCVKLISQKNQGLSAARNTGIVASKGKYLMFVDSDDFLEVNVIGKLVAKTDESNLDILRFNYQNVNELYEVIEPYRAPKKFVDYSETVCDGITFLNERLGFACYAVQFLLKKDLFKDESSMFLKGIYYEDTEWTPRIILKAKRVASVNWIIYNYLLRQDSITTAIDPIKRNKRYNDTLFVIKSLQKQFETIKNKSWCKRMIALMTLSLLARLSKEQNEVKQDIIQSLKKLKVFPLTTEKTILRVKIKLCLINISPWLFMRLV